MGSFSKDRSIFFFTAIRDGERHSNRSSVTFFVQVQYNRDGWVQETINFTIQLNMMFTVNNSTNLPPNIYFRTYINPNRPVSYTLRACFSRMWNELSMKQPESGNHPRRLIVPHDKPKWKTNPLDTRSCLKTFKLLGFYQKIENLLYWIVSINVHVTVIANNTYSRLIQRWFHRYSKCISTHTTHQKSAQQRVRQLCKGTLSGGWGDINKQNHMIQPYMSDVRRLANHNHASYLIAPSSTLNIIYGLCKNITFLAK